MKTKLLNKHVFFLSFVVLFVMSSAHGYRFSGDEVFFTTDESNEIVVLSDELSKHNQRVSDEMPDDVRDDIIKNEGKMLSLSEESSKWISDNLVHSLDDGLSESIDAVVKWSAIHDDDRHAIVINSFGKHVINQPFVLFDEISNYLMYWRENRTPNVQFSPNGLGRINWVWSLSVNKRKFGQLHVGIDEVKRTFICYESDVGLYFPEGETMERIYTEIVQNPERAGIFLGKGLKERKRSTLDTLDN